MGKNLNSSLSKIDFRSYFNEIKSINANNLILFILCLSIGYFILEPIFFDSIFYKSLTFFPHQKNVLKFTFSFTLLYSIFFFCHKIFVLKAFPTIKSILYILSFLLVYIVIFRAYSEYDFYSFKINHIKLYYFDIIVLSISIFFLEFHSYFKPLDFKDKNFILMENHVENDLLYREEYSEEISKILENTSNLDSSISIGVFSEWGSGKTDFLNRLKEKLLKDKNNIILEFNPWLVSKDFDLYDSFFKELSDKLKSYHSNISFQINKYSNSILGQSKTVDIKILQSLINYFNKEKSILDNRNEIKKLIKSTGKKIVVLIDDADRLTGVEMLSLFKLLRSIGDFPNLFYVTFLDYSYTIETLKTVKNLNNEEEYLKKIFQLRFRLPVILKENLVDFVQNTLCRLIPEKYTEIEACIKLYSFRNSNDYRKYDGHIQKMLKNFRDAKLFINSFLIHFKILKDNLEFGDLFLLELLKVANFDLYNRISNREFLRFNNSYGLYDLHCNENKSEDEKVLVDVDQYLKKKDIQNKGFKELLNDLLDSTYKGISKFSDSLNFHLYFSHILPENLISRIEFISFFQKEEDLPFLEKIEIWSNNNKLDLRNILENYKALNDLHKYRKYVKSLLLSRERLGISSFFLDEILIGIDENLSTLKLLDNEKIEFVDNIFAEKKIDPFDRIYFGKFFVSEKVEKNYNITNPAVWQSKIIDLFDTACKDRKTKNLNLYYDAVTSISNIDKQKEPRMYLDENICKSYTKLIEDSPVHLENYINRFFRKGFEIVGDPFWSSFFENKRNFNQILNKFSFKNEETEKLKQLILGQKLENKNLVYFENEQDKNFVSEYIYLRDQPKYTEEEKMILDELRNLGKN